MSTAFDGVLKALSLKRDDPTAEIAARKIIEAAWQSASIRSASPLSP
jgi:hypothetical protein